MTSLHARCLQTATLLLLGCATSQDPSEVSTDAARSLTKLDGSAVQSERDAQRDTLVDVVRTDAAVARTDAAVTRTDAGAQAADAAMGSCYGRCGAPELLALAADCACDVGCLARGDCCADKHALCAVSARAPLCTLTGVAQDPALLGTDLGWVFEHHGKLEVLFGDSYASDGTDPYPNDDAQGVLPLARPAEIDATPAACAGLLQLDKQRAGAGETFTPSVLIQDGEGLSSWLSDTPLTGFSDGANAYMIARRGSKIEDPIYVAVRNESAAAGGPAVRTRYDVGQTYTSAHFQNVTAATVARFDPAAPAQHDYGPGHGSLFLFGRANFAGQASRAMYLSQQPLPLLDAEGTLHFAPSFFAGISDGKPRWTSDERQTVPILSGDFERPMQHEVTFVPALAKWVLLYGGDVADWLDATPNDQPRHGAIHMRLADDPWGPWTSATPVFFREHAAAFMHCDAPAKPLPGQAAGCDLDELPDDPAHSFSPGSWGSSLLDFPGCIGGELTPRQPNFMSGGVVPCLGAQRGNFYAPSVLDSWTSDLAGDQGYAHAARLYFLLSTWMPYQVIVASLTVHLP